MEKVRLDERIESCCGAKEKLSDEQDGKHDRGLAHFDPRAASISNSREWAGNWLSYSFKPGTPPSSGICSTCQSSKKMTESTMMKPPVRNRAIDALFASTVKKPPLSAKTPKIAKNVERIQPLISGEFGVVPKILSFVRGHSTFLLRA